LPRPCGKLSRVFHSESSLIWKNPRRQGRLRQHARAGALPGILALGASLLLSCHRAETDVERGDRLQILHQGNGQYPVVNAEAFNKGKIDNFEKLVSAFSMIGRCGSR
jgi:hypothetical protein